jgi:WD40 repeat protein
MKFTQRTLITACVVVGIGLVGAKLSIKTMQRNPDGTVHVPSLRALSTKKAERSSVQELRKIFSFPSLWNETDQLLLKKLTSTAVLDEFRDKGTVEGEPINAIVTNNWASYIFKPAMSDLVYPYDSNVQVLRGHTGPILSAAFSPDGTRIVTSSWDNTARVWTQQPDGSWTFVVLRGHTGSVNSAVFSPDGTRIVTASADHTARVWTEQPNGTWTSVVLQGHADRVKSAAFSPDGTRIVTSSWDNTGRVWTQQPDGSWTFVVLRGHTGSVNSAVFSPDGTRIVIASEDGTARVWTEQPGGTWTSVVFAGHMPSVLSVAFSRPDGTKFVTALADGTVCVWTQIDLVGNNNVAEKIMLLQLLNRDGKDIFINRQHLRAIWWLFDVQAKSYLIKKYTLTPTMWDRAAIAWGWMKSFVK